MSLTRITTATAITGSGVYHPEHVLDNEELCVAFNEFVRRENDKNAAAIAAGTMQPLKPSSPEFIEKASGIKRRYIMDKSGVLDPDRMCPNIPARPDDQISVQAEFAVKSIERALVAAGRVGEDVDLVVCGASMMQRQYPAMAVEIQNAIGARGFGFDVTLGCSSATMAMQLASQAVRSGAATCAIAVAPDLMTCHSNWRERDGHFLFGDASVAVVIEPLERARPGSWEILSIRSMSKFSTNIRNNYGFLNRCDPEQQFGDDKLFYQAGRRVYKDVIPAASKFISDHLAQHELEPDRVSRYWLHQANQNMNDLIAERVLGRPATREESPVIIAEYGNTASAGSPIAFSLHNDDLPKGALGLMVSFGAGYSFTSLMLRRA
ncbi:MAG: beta-ketoacyl-ACP synthase III [Deltaproteobacteria bacterium]|nr:beta-ketoacyl-ACP synthase III [Deltaproteobacteria bacterium]